MEHTLAFLQELARREVSPVTALQMADMVRAQVQYIAASPVPVPIFMLMQHRLLGIDVKLVEVIVESPAEIAQLGFRGNSPRVPRDIITVKAGIDPATQRFAAAHMLGHLLFHSIEELWGGLVRNGIHHRPMFWHEYTRETTDYREVLANEFAAHLLAPLSILHPMVVRRPDILSLANSLQVPVGVIHMQLERLL